MQVITTIRVLVALFVIYFIISGCMEIASDPTPGNEAERIFRIKFYFVLGGAALLLSFLLWYLAKKLKNHL